MKLRVVVFPLLLLYPFYAGIMYSAQTKILFPASSDQRHALHGSLPANGELVEIPASFGKVRAVYLRPRAGAAAAPAILYTHGNYELIEDSFALMQPLVNAGMPVLQLEFPGFGGADGKPDFASVNEATTLAYDWLAKQREVDPSRIVAVGYSMGGGAAAELSRTRSLGALVLLSTYTSIRDIAHRYALPDFLVRYPFDNLARVHEFTGPILIEHGRHDEVIPFAMGQKLADEKKGIQFIALDCGHADCHFDRSIFSQRLPAWLAENGLLTKKD